MYRVRRSGPPACKQKAAVELDMLQHFAAFANADAPLVGHVGEPDSAFRIDADAVGNTVAEVRPDAPVGRDRHRRRCRRP